METNKTEQMNPKKELIKSGTADELWCGKPGAPGIKAMWVTVADEPAKQLVNSHVAKTFELPTLEALRNSSDVAPEKKHEHFRAILMSLYRFERLEGWTTQDQHGPWHCKLVGEVPSGQVVQPVVPHPSKTVVVPATTVVAPPPVVVPVPIKDENGVVWNTSGDGPVLVKSKEVIAVAEAAAKLGIYPEPPAINSPLLVTLRNRCQALEDESVKDKLKIHALEKDVAYLKGFTETLQKQNEFLGTKANELEKRISRIGTAIECLAKALEG